MCTRFDNEVNSHTSTRKLVTTLFKTIPSKIDQSTTSYLSRQHNHTIPFSQQDLHHCILGKVLFAFLSDMVKWSI